MSPLMVKETAGVERDPVSEEVHFCACYQIVDLGTHKDEYQGKVRDRHVVAIGWETDETGEFTIDDETVVLPLCLWKSFTLTLSEKGSLRPFLESWRGKQFTPDELVGFDLANLQRAGCQIQVIHKQKKDGGTKADIAAIMPLPSGVTAPALVAEPQYYSIEEHGTVIPDNLPKWMVEEIQSSHEYKELVGTIAADEQAEPAPDFADADESLPF